MREREKERERETDKQTETERENTSPITIHPSISYSVRTVRGHDGSHTGSCSMLTLKNKSSDK